MKTPYILLVILFLVIYSRIIQKPLIRVRQHYHNNQRKNSHVTYNKLKYPITSS